MGLSQYTDYHVKTWDHVPSDPETGARRWDLQSPRRSSKRLSQRQRLTSNAFLSKRAKKTGPLCNRISPTFVAPSTSSRTWRVISRWLHTSDKDANFWWHATGPLLATLLVHAGYSPGAQYEALLFHYSVISSALGPRPISASQPRSWKSFMTDDFSPMELSWSWDDGTAQSHPAIRYSVEAIGTEAGTAADPFNQSETRNVIQQIKSIATTSDWQWFEKLAQVLCPSSLQSQDKVPSLWSGSDPSSMFLGFAFQEKGLGAKAYLAPTKAAVTGQSALNVITDGIRSLENDATKFPAYDGMLHYLTHSPVGRSLEVLGIALDCVDPSKARLKLYVRSADTSFDSVRKVMCMDGLATVKSDQAMEDLWSLWKSVLNHGESFSSSDQLQPNSHHTSGILYNFEIKANVPATDPKVYIPVKHYSANDRAVADGLTDFLSSRGGDRFASQYLQMLESLCVHRSLEESRGLQTYIQCGLQNEGIALTSYMAPEIYHQAKWLAS